MKTRRQLCLILFAGLLLLPLAATAADSSSEGSELGAEPFWIIGAECNNWEWSWSAAHAGYCANSAGPDCAGGTCGADGNGRFQFISGNGVCSCFCCADDYNLPE